MRIITLAFEQIDYEEKTFSNDLYESIVRRGFAFPIRVNEKNGHYECVDGHKRLSCLHHLKKHCPSSKNLKQIPVIVVNSDLIRSNDCWRGRNTH